MKPRLLVVTAALIGAAVTSAPTRAVAPFQGWRTLRSECCDVHYPRRLEALARRVAPLSDEVDAMVVGLLGRAPSDRVQIVLEDETDFANGWALTVPYNTVHLNAVAPDNYSPLIDTDERLRGLLVHEYAHIVHLDTVGGMPAAVQRLTGKLWSPNQVQPPWFLEGIAIYAETRFSSGGRIRSSLHDMYMRTAALNDRVRSLDELSSGTRQWPHGSAWLYGGRFINFIVERYGEQTLATISARYGAQLLPYGINRAARGVLDRSYDELYEEWRAQLRAEAMEVRDRVEALGPDPSRRLTRFGETVRDPLPHGDHGVYLYAAPRDESPGLYRYDRLSGRALRLVELNGFGGMDLLPDGGLLLSQPDIHDDHFAFHDLYRLDPATGGLQRLTHGLRALAPAVAPDGRSALFVRRDAYSCALARIDLATLEVEDLLTFDDGSQLFTPVVSPDGRWAVVGLWRPGGSRDLWRVELASGALRRLTEDRALDLDPAFSSDGSHLLFSSDRDGVFHVYSMELRSGAVWQVTNAVTGAFAPAPGPGGERLYFTGYTADGFDLFELDARDVIGLPASSSYGRPRPRPAPAATVEAAQHYNPLPTLRPHAWIPVVSSDQAGPTIGASVEGRDAVSLHQYAAQVSWGTLSGSLNASAGYGYNDLPTPLRLTLGRYEGDRMVLTDPRAAPTPQRERGWRAEALLIWPRRSWRRSHMIGIGYGVEASDADAVSLAPDEGAPRLPWRGRTCAARLFWSYGDTRRFVDSISTERGLTASLSLRGAHPALGSESSFLELFGDGAGYLQVPGLSGHVVAVLLQGGAALGPREQRRLYAIGGLPTRDLVQDALLGVRLGGGYLRGYPNATFAGDGFLLGSLEYRLPLLSMERGISTLPFFFDRVSGVLFADMGGAFFDAPRAQDFMHRGLGGELRASLVLGFMLPLTLRLGIARGFDQEGLAAQPYFALGAHY